MDFTTKDILREVVFKTSRSGGKGGQHVNKVSSKVELNFDIPGSSILSEDQKTLLMQKLFNRITSKGILQVVCEEDRSQFANKERCVEKLLSLLNKGLQLQKVRKATKPGRSAVEERLKSKQLQAMKKINRRNFFSD